MKNCDKCNASNPDDAIFCSKCGKRIYSGHPDTKTSGYKEIYSETDPLPTPTKRTVSTTEKIIVWIVCIVLIGGLIVGVIFLLINIGLGVVTPAVIAAAGWTVWKMFEDKF
jgi:uncharacterized membrane protein YvbJ